MQNIRDALIRFGLFALVFFSWMWVLAQPFSDPINLGIIVGAVILAFPVIWLGRVLLDRDPDPENAAWMTTLMHALLMVLFGASIIRALSTFESWRGWLLPIPVAVGFALLVVTGALAAITVANLVLRGRGAPFGIALSRRLAVDWMYAWTRNPILLSTLALLLALGLWFQSSLFILWVLLLLFPALLYFVKVFEERELEIRFGEPYRQYRSRTPMLLPRRPLPRNARPSGSKALPKSRGRKPSRTKTKDKRKAR